MTLHADYWDVLPFDKNVSRVGDTPEGLDHIDKFGHNPDIDAAPSTTPEEIWSGGGEYTFSSVATSYYVSSSEAADTQDVTLKCLVVDEDNNWVEEDIVVTLQGQTKVQVVFDSGDLPIRFYRGWNDGATSFTGDVYIYEDDTTTGGIPDTQTKWRGVIAAGDDQTEMAIYTIPSGKNGYFEKINVQLGASRNSYAVFTYAFREVGKSFRVQGRGVLDNTGSNWWEYDYSYPPKLEPKTDIIVTCIEVGANDTDVTARFDILLVDTE